MKAGEIRWDVDYESFVFHALVERGWRGGE